MSNRKAVGLIWYLFLAQNSLPSNFPYTLQFCIRIFIKYKADKIVSMMFHGSGIINKQEQIFLERKGILYLLFGFAVNKWVNNLPCSHKYVRHMNYKQFAQPLRVAILSTEHSNYCVSIFGATKCFYYYYYATGVSYNCLNA